MTAPSKYQANHKQGDIPLYYEAMSVPKLNTEPLERHINEARSHFTKVLPEIEGFLPQIGKRAVLFIDIETSGTRQDSQVITAVMARLNGDIHLQGYAALNPLQEQGLLKAVATELAQSRYVVTHGGQSFDIPFLEKRYAAHGQGALVRTHHNNIPLRKRHLDLVGYARQALRTPDMSLQTLEKTHLGYTRTNDMQSREIPNAYERFLEGDADHELTEILKHNARDTLATMALFCYLATRR